MRNLSLPRTIVATAALLLILVSPVYAGSMGISGGHDLDRLWTQAQDQFDLSKNDAVVLLESRHVSISADGNRVTRTHRVVWIGAELGIDENADLRIPYNSATSSFDVIALRTWRDGQWWPDPEEISGTAVVETLPFAMARADDYTSMRETMLLHDGVEIPCIIETAYVIEERAGAVDGCDGLWVFPQSDPAVVVEFALSIPEGKTLVYNSGNGAPEPVVNTEADRMVTYLWKMEHLDRLGSPRIADPASYAPYVTWSTWPDWNTLGRKIVSSFNETAVLDTALADTLAEHLKHEPSLASKARAIAALVNEYTRAVDYDSRFWQFSPRPASRTWETAYGHSLDRAVLAAALFREAGLGAEPLYISSGSSTPDLDVPGLSGFEDIMIFVDTGHGTYAVYDPAEGTLKNEQFLFLNRCIWHPGVEAALEMNPALASADVDSRFELILTMEPDGKDGWNGSGFFNADGIFCPYDEMKGLHGEALAHIEKILNSVLPGSHVGGYNPETFNSYLVTVGIDFTLKAGEPDDQGWTRIVIGNPTGGVIANLQSDVHLYHEHRDTPVPLPGNMLQRIKLRLRTGERDIVHLPEARTLENEAGSFSLTVEREGDWVTVERSLKLSSGPTAPEAWPQLRILLLEETDASSRTILFK